MELDVSPGGGSPEGVCVCVCGVSVQGENPYEQTGVKKLLSRNFVCGR